MNMAPPFSHHGDGTSGPVWATLMLSITGMGRGSHPKGVSVHGTHLDPVLGPDHSVDALPRWIDDEAEPEEVPA